MTMNKNQKMIPVFRPNYGTQEIQAVTRVLKSGWIGLGPKTAEFEERFASYVGVRHAVAVNSGTAALHMALLVANIGPGDEVIVPSLTFVSTVHVVMYVGARPIFADVEPDVLCLSPEDVARKITTKTRAVIPVHYGGHPCDMEQLRQLTTARGITLIDDAAHACGAVYRGNRIGSISPFTCFSFHAVKNLATGDGGMITTNDSDGASRLRRLRWMGIIKDTWSRLETLSRSGKVAQKAYGWYYEIPELGYKCHMNDITAALGLVQLGKLEVANKRRQELAAIYTEGLSDLPGIECPVVRPGVITAQHNYVIRCDRRDELHLYLREHNISSGVHYMPVHLHPFYLECYPDIHLPVTEAQWPRLLTLPLYPQLTAEEQAYIIKTIVTFVGKD